MCSVGKIIVKVILAKEKKENESLICNISLLHIMSYVTLTFEVGIRVKVTAHRLNEDNICTWLDGNP